ncbi:Transcriptional regulatory protein [Thermus sp. CCB_US3_UF1]|uniref:response regulator transcription factor n=1 Tax=Thermus sp. CCB_US3_UF1 TaxID=1111069 RepID=UPI00023895A2|nr:response regulator transcription factor [Thermus sp. CCB_US3_UF1]AEV15777.1 Transcriptional regulatory protein [Thermus sp. CCB_US3_UF1]
MPTILVVDDEPAFREMVSRLLEQEGYRILQAENGEEALGLLGRADLVVLDINMPKLNGLELLEIIREYDRELPVLMLTAYDKEEDRVTGLTLGADDYMGKPLRAREFLARVKALLRRSKRFEVLRVGSLELDPFTEEARLEGRLLDLSSTEFRLLLALARHPGATLPRAHLFAQVWGLEEEVDERVVDTTVARLRKKLGDNPKNPRYIATVFGRGYRLLVDQGASP